MFFRLGTIFILLFFYGVYFGKMLRQRRRGIQTDQMGRGRKERRVYTIERVMKIATIAVVAAQVVSLCFAWSFLPVPLRAVGMAVGFLGDLIFALSVFTMRDSWRAGIPESDETAMVTEGIYSVSRNPAFLGFDLLYLGVLLVYGNPLTLVFSLWAAVMLHLQILSEERHLSTVFGDTYLAYKARVGRYLGKRRRK